MVESKQIALNEIQEWQVKIQDIQDIMWDVTPPNNSGEGLQGIS